MMKYDHAIKSAILYACDKLTKAEFSRRVGFRGSVFAMIMSGKVTGAADGTWEKMWPILVEHGGLNRNALEYYPRSKLIKITLDGIWRKGDA